MKMISEKIGWDGSEFFCRRCGKAGYDRMAQVKGHLAMCPGRAIERGAVPAASRQLATASYSPVGMSSFGLSSPSPATSQQQQLGSVMTTGYSQLDERVKQLENEYNHVLLDRNLPNDGWFVKNKSMIILGAVLMFAFVMMLRENKCGCESKSKSSFADLGGKALSKFVDRGIIKGVDSLFGK